MFEKLMTLPALAGTRVWLRDHHPFDSQNNWYDFLKTMVEKITSNDLSERASAVSFNLFLALFPAIIFLFTLIPYIPIDNLEGRIMSFLGRTIPAGTFDTVEITIRDIIGREQSGILSFGFLLTLYAATNGMLAFMNAFNSSHKTEDSRGILKTRLVAAGLTFAFVLALFFAIVLLILGGVVIDYLTRFGLFNNELIIFLLNLGRYLLVLGVFVGVLSLLYRFGPEVNMKWTFVTPGSVAASLLIVLTSLAFSYYLANFGSYNKLYGSIGTLIALMVWINLISMLVILGFEMNVSLFEKTRNATSNV
jgi:membrane protein